MSASVHPGIVFALRSMARAMMQKITDDEIEAIAETVSDCSPEAIRDACGEIAKHERYFPRPVVIRSYIERQRNRVHRAPAPAEAPREVDGEAVWSCLGCQDQGFRPITADGRVISWDQSRGVGAYYGRGTGHHHVDWCTLCSRLRKPTPALTHHTYDDQQTDRKTR